MKKVLWLPSWYPNQSDPYDGDFIRRMAEAVSIKQPIIVVFVDRDQNLKESKTIKPVMVNDQFKEYIVYYKIGRHIARPFSKIISFYRYFLLHLKIFRHIKDEGDMPDMVHVHVAFRAGLIALFLKWRYNIPYLLTEHWTAYYRGSRDSLFDKPWLHRFLIKLIIRKSKKFLPVSDALGHQINRYWTSKEFLKIPNVVDTNLFYFRNIEPKSKFRFIHVSSMIEQKNPEGIIRAFISVLKRGIDAELILVGPVKTSLQSFIRSSNLRSDQLRCTGELSYQDVSKEMSKANALILFSYTENLPCVVLEALCSGIPVIATRVGGLPEIIDHQNGMLIDAGNEDDLADAMCKFAERTVNFASHELSMKASQQYSYQAISEEISSIYENLRN